MARMLFVIGPAAALGALAWLLSPGVGIGVGFATIWLGLNATRRRPERGET